MERASVRTGVTVLLVGSLVFFFCQIKSEPAAKGKKGEIMPLKVTSSAFRPGTMIPAKYTCDGDDTSPPLAWDGVPPETKSLVLTCDDPDAPGGTWDHWLVFNISAEAGSLSEAASQQPTLPTGSIEGVNSWGKSGYGGPCPPSGTHRYFFTVYALDGLLSLKASARKPEVEAAMHGHILARGQLMGTYKRK